MRKDRKSHPAIGYGKPPPHTRFMKGKSGNPRGRPKGARSFRRDLKAALDAQVVSADGKRRKISTQAAVLQRLRKKALSGDNHALDRLIQLAQVYNNYDEQIEIGGLSTNDQQILRIYRERVLSGAAGEYDQDIASDANQKQSEGTGEHEDGAKDK
jgi:hypothetical protein